MSVLGKMDSNDIQEKVRSVIVALLPQEKRGLFSDAASLVDMGLGLLELAELRESLSHIFGESLHETFLTRYYTPQLISDYFIQRHNSRYRDWLYNVEWVELPFPLLPSTPSTTEGPWLIFSDDSGLADALMAKLNSYGFTSVEVKSGAYFNFVKPNQFIIRPGSEEDYEQLFKSELFLKGISGVVYLWGLFNEIPEEPSLNLLESLHEFSCGGLLNLLKALANHCTSTLARLWVSSWSMSEEGDPMALAQWPMTGLCKAISMEQPGFKLRQVSFNIQESRLQSADNLFLELFAVDKEEQISWRGQKRLAPRLIRVELPEVNPPQFKKEGTYLITGGLGGLGLALAKWHLERGADQLVLIDSNSISPEAETFLHELESQGAAIKIYQNINIGDTKIMANIMNEIQQSLPPLKGIMHVAGLIDDDLLLNLNWSRFQPIFNLKVGGAWNLHTLTKSLPLDHFILFSSIGSAMGPLWRANRSSANAFLDALAHYRKIQGLVALTINWGPWSHEGMAVKKLVETNIPEGLNPLSTEEGVEVLDHVLNVSIPEVVAASIDWPIFLRRFSYEKPLFVNMAREAGLRKSEMVEQFQSARAEERRHIIPKYLGMLLRRVLQLSPTTKLDETHTFSMIGLDGRTLLDLKNQIQYDMPAGVDLPFGIMDLNSSIRQLSEALYPLIEAQVLRSKQGEYHKLFGNHLNKVALITGGSRGIGEKVARILIYAGASVALLARSHDQLQRVRKTLIEELVKNGETKPEHCVLVSSCDMSQSSSIETCFEEMASRFGRIDYVVNNAGVSGGEQLVFDMPTETWRLTLEANLISNYDLMIRALPYMKKQKSGHIINVSSEFGGLRYATPAYPNRADYAVSKAGNRSLAEIFAPILGPEIQINAIAPGPVQGARVEGDANTPGLYLRRSKLNQENKRLNSLYNILVEVFRTRGDLSSLLDSISLNKLELISSKPHLPESIQGYIHAITQQSREIISGCQTHLLTKKLAQRLLRRLKSARCLPASYSEAHFFESFVEFSENASAGSFFPESELKAGAEHIRKRIVKALALGHMPSEEEVAKEIILTLSNKYITGETIYPSCGLSLDRLSTSGDFMGHFYPILYEALALQTLMIVGDSMYEEMAEVTLAYLKAKNINNIILVVGSESGKDKIYQHFSELGFPEESLDKRISLRTALMDEADLFLDSLFDEYGFPQVMISFPRGTLPNKGESWQDLPTLEHFKRIIEEQITHHFQIARRGALIDDARVFLITPKLPPQANRLSILLTRFIQATLASFTVTLGEESARMTHQAVFYQVDMNVDLDASLYAEKLIDALLVLSLPLRKADLKKQNIKRLVRLGHVIKI